MMYFDFSSFRELTIEDFTFKTKSLFLKPKLIEIFFASKIISLFCLINSEDEEFKKNEDKNKTEPIRKNKATKYTKMLFGIKLFLLKEFHAS